MHSIEETVKEVPLKSTRKGVVVTIQGLSVIAVLEGVFAFLRAKFGLEVSSSTVHLIVAMVSPFITGMLHGAVKRACHKLGIEIRFLGLPKTSSILLLVLLPLVGLGGCAAVTQKSGDPTAPYKYRAIAFGDANIDKIRSMMSQEVKEADGSGSTTVIGQESQGVKAEGGDFIADAVRGAIQGMAAAFSMYQQPTVGNEPAASGGNSNVKNTTGGGLPPIKFSGE